MRYRTRSLMSVRLAMLAGLICVQQTLAAPVSFQQAVKDYSAGQYALALSEFEPYKASNPNNALVRYYIALCHQGMNHFSQAKTEFEWVAAHGDPKLAAMAKAGFEQLSRINSGSSRGTAIASAPTAVGGSTKPAAKVKKIIEFYADW